MAKPARPPKDPQEIRVKNTPPFKLKDRPGRQYQAIHLKTQFGFIPEVIIIEKVRGSNNALIVRAVLTPEEIAQEEGLKKKIEAQRPADENKLHKS
jgi:hypothetical protein